MPRNQMPASEVVPKAITALGLIIHGIAPDALHPNRRLVRVGDALLQFKSIAAS
jgi:hypothetical protein